MTKNAATLALLTALNTQCGYDLTLNAAMNIVRTMTPHLMDDAAAADADALLLAAQGGADLNATVAYARTNAEVMQALADGKPIAAIKALRTAINGGLKECKDAVDVLRRDGNFV